MTEIMDPHPPSRDCMCGICILSFKQPVKKEHQSKHEPGTPEWYEFQGQLEAERDFMRGSRL